MRAGRTIALVLGVLMGSGSAIAGSLVIPVGQIHDQMGGEYSYDYVEINGELRVRGSVILHVAGSFVVADTGLVNCLQHDGGDRPPAPNGSPGFPGWPGGDGMA